MIDDVTRRTRAQCDDCPGVAIDATMRAARFHADSHGHTVQFIDEKVSILRGVEEPVDDQEDTAEARFGRAVREAREARGWTQEALRSAMVPLAVHFTKTQMSRLEHGQRPIRVNEMAALSRVLGIPHTAWAKR